MSHDAILIVDDNSATRYAVRRVLEHHGFAVHEAETAGQGQALIKAGDFRAVVLDVNLPDFSGFELVRRLRLVPATQLLPIVHVSAASMHSRDVVTGLEAGADAYLIHPVDPDVLVATLRTLLRARRAEEALVKSEGRAREIYSNVAAPIAVMDVHLVVIESNPAFNRAFALGSATHANLSGYLLHGQDSTIAAMKQAIVSDRTWSGSLVTVSGRETEWRLAPYSQPGQSLLFMLDVTEQRDRERRQQRTLDRVNDQLEQEIEQRLRSESQLVQAQKMDALGQLTGGIAHDFNNQLTSIVSGIDVIEASLESGREDRVKRFIDIVRRGALGAAALTQRLLAFGRRQALVPVGFDLHQQAKTLEEMFRRTIGERIELIVEPAIEPVVAYADINQFENVLLNLVINARDAMPHGGHITIEIRTVDLHGDSDLDDGTYASLVVRDTGGGMPADVIDKVFEPFFTTKPLGQGTGLGLSMAYGFARQSRGTIRIESVVGLGTSVEILLPLGTAEKAEPVLVKRGAAPGQSQRVLLVDDNALLREVAADMLTEAGYDVTEASDGQQALELLQTRSDFDLLITDVGLPRLNGRDLADRIAETRPGFPVIFITGYAADALDRPFVLSDAVTLLPKPFSMSELLERVETLLTTRTAHPAG